MCCFKVGIGNDVFGSPLILLRTLLRFEITVPCWLGVKHLLLTNFEHSCQRCYLGPVLRPSSCCSETSIVPNGWWSFCFTDISSLFSLVLPLLGFGQLYLINGRKALITIQLTFVFSAFFFYLLYFHSCFHCWWCVCLIVVVTVLSFWLIVVLQIPPSPISSPNHPHFPLLLPPSPLRRRLLSPSPPLPLLHSLACFKVGGGNEVFSRQLNLLWSNRVFLPALLPGVCAARAWA